MQLNMLEDDTSSEGPQGSCWARELLRGMLVSQRWGFFAFRANVPRPPSSEAKRSSLHEITPLGACGHEDANYRIVHFLKSVRKNWRSSSRQTAALL
jgi:hypothetical protein